MGKFASTTTVSSTPKGESPYPGCHPSTKCGIRELVVTTAWNGCEGLVPVERSRASTRTYGGSLSRAEQAIYTAPKQHQPSLEHDRSCTCLARPLTLPRGQGGDAQHQVPHIGSLDWVVQGYPMKGGSYLIVSTHMKGALPFPVRVCGVTQHTHHPLSRASILVIDGKRNGVISSTCGCERSPRRRTHHHESINPGEAEPSFKPRH